MPNELSYMRLPYLTGIPKQGGGLMAIFRLYPH
jgi:hypothetical protein